MMTEHNERFRLLNKTIEIAMQRIAILAKEARDAARRARLYGILDLPEPRESRRLVQRYVRLLLYAKADLLRWQAELAEYRAEKNQLEERRREEIEDAQAAFRSVEVPDAWPPIENL